MHLHPLITTLLAGALLTVGLYRRTWLLGVWIVSFLVFPTAHTRVAEAPIYLYDLIGIVLILCFVTSGEAARWPRGIPRWHWWFIGSGFVLSVLFGAIRLGFLPDMIWIWGHTSLAWMAFAFGVVVSTAEDRVAYRNAMVWGFLVSAVVFCTIGVVQYIDISGSDRISRFFYDDLGSVKSVEILRRGATTNRATGPHFAPTGFAGIALLSIIAGWLLTDPRDRFRRVLLLGLFSITILCTVSRHIMVAAFIGVVVLVSLSNATTRLKTVGLALLAVAAISTSAMGLSTKDSWGSRLAKWDRGILKDDNVAARVLWGPERLGRYIAERPSVLITGAGLDIEKLARHSGVLDDFEGGFVSNGFLLALYYLGLGGFILYVAFWIWGFRVALHGASEMRGVLIAAILVQIIVVAADNYSFVHEPAVCLLFLNVGLMAGNQHTVLVETVEAEEAEAGGPAFAH